MNRAHTWYQQALKDFEHAELARKSSHHDWACFAAQQAALKAVVAWRLRSARPDESVPVELGEPLVELGAPRLIVEAAAALDGYHSSARFPDEKSEHAPFELIGPAASAEALRVASAILTLVRTEARLDQAEPPRREQPTEPHTVGTAGATARWPDAKTVVGALRLWAQRTASRPVGRSIIKVGYAGAYARGDWGVGSSLDVVLVVESSDLPFEYRSREWDVRQLPVPVTVAAYTVADWEALENLARGNRLRRETLWVYDAKRVVAAGYANPTGGRNPLSL